MSERRATVIVCDEILYSVTGKVFLQGVYQSDIAIPGSELAIGQLLFYFIVETPRERPFQKVALKIILPQMPPTTIETQLTFLPVPPDRKTMVLRAPFLLQQPILRPGKVETLVVTEGEELDAGGIWINSLQPPMPN